MNKMTSMIIIAVCVIIALTATVVGFWVIPDKNDVDDSLQNPTDAVIGMPDNTKVYPAINEADYLKFLKGFPEYNYYALLDINGDGVLEMLATDQVNSRFAPVYMVDLFVYKNGTIRLGYDDIWAKYEVLLYDDSNCWIAQYHGGSGGDGMSFYYVDEQLNVRETSFDTRCDEVDKYGNEVWRKFYNGMEILNGNYTAYDQLVSRWENSDPKDIVFQEIPKSQQTVKPQQNQVQPTQPVQTTKPVQPAQSVADRVKEIKSLYYGIEDELSEYRREDGGSNITRYLDDYGTIRKITALTSSYADLGFDSKYNAEYFYDNDMVFFVFLFNRSEEHRIYLDKYDYRKCVRYIDQSGVAHDYPDGMDIDELPDVGYYCVLAMQELHWAGVN